jgi:alpha-tubulin suppressor-like RCC1 family protein
MRLAAFVVLLALGAAALPAVGRAASPGQLYAFGDNIDGQLGNEINLGYNAANPTPALVTLPGEVGSVSQAAAGGGFSMVVTSSGQLYGFGEDADGDLGHRAGAGAPPPYTPTQVTLPGATGPVVQTAGGFEHSLAVTSTGQLYAFGSNDNGQLGIQTNSGKERTNATPTLVSLPGATGSVVRVAAGGRHSLALTTTGQLYAFGDNRQGELGSAAGEGGESYGFSNPTPRLVALPGATGPVTQIAAGAYFSLAATSTGQLYAFGENYNGQLGNEVNLNCFLLCPSPAPALVTLPGEIGPVIQLAAGYGYSLALTSSGQLYAFGENDCGELGNAFNLKGAHSIPTLVNVPGARGRIVRIAAGADSLALTSTGQLYGFGCSRFGELGIPPDEHPILEEERHPPMPLALPGEPNVETMATGGSHTLVVIAGLAVSTSSLSAGEAGFAYSAPAQATGGSPPYRWSATGLPAGLSIDPATGTITGTPTVGGGYTPTITVTDSYGIEASASLPLAVRPLPATPGETAPLAVSGATSPSLGLVRASRARTRSASVTRRRTSPSVQGDSPSGTSLDMPLSGTGLVNSPLDTPLGGAGPAASASDISPMGVSPQTLSSWTVHKYLRQIAKAGSQTLDRPIGLAFNSAGDLLLTEDELNAKEEYKDGYVYRYGPSDEFECQIGDAFPEGSAESVSVNDETGNVYVGESRYEEVWLYKPQGGCPYKPPVPTEAGGSLYLAVDNVPGPRHGDVYLLESHNALFSWWQAWDIKTNAEGELSKTLFTELPEPQSGSEATTSGIAVDPADGTVYVPNSKYGVVDVYNDEDQLESRTLRTGEPFKPIAVAVDPSNGEVYVVDAKHDVVDEFDSQGELIGEITGAHTPAGKFVEPRDVAVKPSTHEVYVSDSGAHVVDIFSADETAPLAAKPTTETVSGIGPAGATLNGSLEHAAGEPLSWFFRYARGSSCVDGNETERKSLAESEMGVLREHASIEKLEPATEYTVCFSDEGTEGVPGAQSAVSFETAGLAPEGSGVTVKSVTPFDAVFEGAVNPQNEATSYRFEYATNPVFTSAVAVGNGSFAKGVYTTKPVDPTDLAAALAPDTTYYVRLYAENATGHYTSASTSFTTLPITATAVSFWNASEGETVSEERLEGYIDPDYQSTTCAFQYTTESQYAQHGFMGAANVPCAPSPVGTSTTAFSEVVTATATGLQAGVTYDYRLTATNYTGTSEGPVAPATATFSTWGPPTPTTQPAAELSPNSATFFGMIDPDHLATTYHYEYTSESAYMQAVAEGRPNPYIGGHSTPDEHAGSGTIRETLPSTHVSELAAGTTYHYRLVASNEAGTRYGQDETFTTERELTATTPEGTTPPTITTNPPSVQPTSPSLLATSPSKSAKPAHTRLTNVQKLKRALRACRKHYAHSKRRRQSCERSAHTAYSRKKPVHRRG